MWRTEGAEDPAAGLPAVAANEPAAGGQTGTVAALASTQVVKVPTWFTAAAALRVARLKGVDHLLVLDRQQLVGSVSSTALASAAGHLPLERLMSRTRVTVAPDAPLEEAWKLMACHGVDCLPVTSGALLLGILSRHDARRPQAATGT
jgi:CBS domain-containing protein